jgi:hypothetical protein
MASLRPSPVMLLTPLLGEAATTSQPPWRRMATVFESMPADPQMSSNASVENYPSLLGLAEQAHNPLDCLISRLPYL